MGIQFSQRYSQQTAKLTNIASNPNGIHAAGSFFNKAALETKHGCPLWQQSRQRESKLAIFVLFYAIIQPTRCFLFAWLCNC